MSSSGKPQPMGSNLENAGETKKTKSTEASSGAPDSSRAGTSSDPYESPKKKAKISFQTLRNSSSRVGVCKIGDVLKLPQVLNGVVRKGEVKAATLRCVVVENRLGRTPAEESARSGRRFLYLADYTGFISIGVDSKECGVNNYDIQREECSDSSLCCFAATVSGQIAWIPTRNSPADPTFFLNNGTIKKVELTSWEEENRLAYPTSDVLTQLIQSKYSSSSSFGTIGISGRIDVCCENNDSGVVLSLEDPVGYTAVEICINKDEQGSTNGYIEQNNMKEGNFVFIRGLMEVHGLPASSNAILKGESSRIRIHHLNGSEFASYVKALLDTDKTSFVGTTPEKM